MQFPENCETTTLEDMIEQYFEPELLTNDNKYRCESSICNSSLQDFEKSMEIDEYPNHLIINLARFQYDPVLQRRSKILTNVHYPQTIHLPNQNGENYFLYGVVMHSGNSAHNGHYYTYARNSQEVSLGKNSRWYKLNDSSVAPSSYNSFCRITETMSRDVAYILFYVRENVKPNLQSEMYPELMIAQVEEDNKDYKGLRQKRKQKRDFSFFPPDDSNRRDPPGPGGFNTGFEGSRMIF
eukprot:TRINITY_DN4765_c0_g1_i2.p1 TRINITY_DN4765_c0_g1~~TRINITY_DN4765_c0_g1_i2.p1  ORF type:complete len:239 (+),score=37.05 TRINITY_DN4765_c0_g1_i2:578-1294(+)